MFIYSIKATTIKFAVIIGVAMVSLAAIILFVPEYTPRTTAAIAKTVSEYNFDKVKTNEDRVEFLKQFGWEVDPEISEEVTLKIPAEFDKVMNTYNELQKKQGLDLTPYKGVRVKSWSYEILNYPGYENTDGLIRGNLLTYNGVVIACDICNISLDGFMETLL